MPSRYPERSTRASGGMADALASGASEGNLVGVQVPPRPPHHTTLMQVSGGARSVVRADSYWTSTYKSSYKSLLLRREKAYTLAAVTKAAVRPPARRWGPGTASIVRLLVASEAPATQVALAAAVGVSQPRVSQVIKQLTELDAVRATPGGFVGRRARLLDLYLDRSRPATVEPDSFWYSTRSIPEQARRIVEAAAREHAQVAFSADLGPDLLVPWRHPTMAVVYAGSSLGLETAGLVRAEGRADASTIVRRTNDQKLLVPAPSWPRAVDGIPLVDPVQQWWDLIDLGGDDRREAAGRLRRAILDRLIRAPS